MITYHTNIQKAFHIVALIKENRQKFALGLRFFIEGGFVRFIGEKNIPDCDFIADMLVPFCNDTAFDALALSRHNYGCCHKLTPVYWILYIVKLFNNHHYFSIT